MFRYTKFFLDYCVALCALPFVLLLAVVVFFFVKVKEPKGKLFFAQERIGYKGKKFKVFKFRTMVENADEVLNELLSKDEKARTEFETHFKLKKDPRVIAGVGAFLRKTSLDEMPQFFNVLKGEMSVVGPRPVTEQELEKYGEYTQKFLSVKPGVTGLWQVSGRNDISYDERVALDMQYIEESGFFKDVKIILATVKVVLVGTGY